MATPEAYRSDEYVDMARSMAGAGNCTLMEGERCHIPFVPDPSNWETSKVGVMLYGGGLVDTRGYSVLAVTMVRTMTRRELRSWVKSMTIPRFHRKNNGISLWLPSMMWHHE